MPKFEYDYYSGEESNQFRFLRIPKVFFEDPDYENLGSDEKILYGFLHEQVDLSQKNGWIDEEGRTYVVRSLESMQQILHNCSEDKARTTLKNLIDFGLVEKKRRGLGKPDLIYVKNFVTKKHEKGEIQTPTISGSEKSKEEAEKFSEPEKNGFLNQEKPVSRTRKNPFQEPGNFGFKNQEISGSRTRNFRVQEPENSCPIDTNINNTKCTETISNPITITEMNSVNGVRVDRCDRDEMGNMEYSIKGDGDERKNIVPVTKGDMTGAYKETEKLIAQIKTNIEYDFYSARYRSEHNDCYEELVQVICEMVVGKRDTVQIGGAEYPYSLVKERFLSLNPGHVEYALEKLVENTGEIRNIKKYMIATLFNAPTTMNSYISQQVYHDMHTINWGKKGATNA